MQYEGVLAQLRDAVVAVEQAGTESLDVDAFTVLFRRLDVVRASVLQRMDDVSAAKASGDSVRAIRASRAATRRIAAEPSAAAALASGTVSKAQAEVVASNPSVADRLLQAAPGKTPEELRRKAVSMQENSMETEEARYQYRQRHKSYRTWVDPEGMANILLRLVPDEAAIVLNAVHSIEVSLDRAPDISPEAHRANAFLHLLSSSSSSPGRQTVINVHVDYESLLRGWVEGDGYCEVAGLGSLPVARVRSQLEDAVLQVLVSAKNRLVWAGRSDKPLPQRIKDSVNAHNRHCCVKCGALFPDVDHRVASVNGGSHDVSNLQSLCESCHGDKTVNEAPWSAVYYENRQPRAG